MITTDSLINDTNNVAQSIVGTQGVVNNERWVDWLEAQISGVSLYILIAETIVIVLLLIMLYLDTKQIKRLKRFNAQKVFELDTLKRRMTAPVTTSRVRHENVATTMSRRVPAIERQQPVSAVPTVQPPCKTYRYLSDATDGRFSKAFETANNKCYFRMWEEQGTIYYEFCGNEERALANMDALFDDVCEVLGNRRTAHGIKNEAPGILDKQFKVIRKAIIQLIP